MYFKSQGIFNISVPFIDYYNAQDKNELLKKVIYLETAQKIYTDIGLFICPLEIKQIISSQFNQLDFTKVYLIIKLSFINFLPFLNSNVLVIVDYIDAKKNIIAQYGPFKTFIHFSQLPDGTFKFNREALTLTSDTKQIKKGDILKCKVVEYSKDESGSPRIRLTLRQPNLGKISWWT